MELRICRNAVELLKRYSDEIAPVEAVALLVGKVSGLYGEVDSVYLVSNERKSSSSFSVSPEDLAFVARDLGEKDIIGVFHSHPFWKAYPSSADMRYMWGYKFWLILGVDGLRCFTLSKENVVEVDIRVEERRCNLIRVK